MLVMDIRRNAYKMAAAIAALAPVAAACSGDDMSENAGSSVPEGMVEVRPVLPGVFSSIPRDPAGNADAATRKYDDNDATAGKLNKTLRLPEGSTVWLIAENETSKTYVKKSYVVYNPEDETEMSYLVPCEVDDEGNVKGMESTPLYLKDGETYNFSAMSPARAIDENEFKTSGKVTFRAKNGEYFYANDCRYDQTSPGVVKVQNVTQEAVTEVVLKPMINQTAELRFLIESGTGVHDLDIQPSGIEVSGLQNDDKTVVSWHMSRQPGDEPIDLKHSDKDGIYHQYNYTLSEEDGKGTVGIEVPVLPMYCLSKPVTVLFRLKVNGVPSTYEMMINERDFKAGYSYGYRGVVSVSEGVSVMTWQYVSWEDEIVFPFDD